MEDDDTASSPPMVLPDRRRRRPSVSAEAAQHPSAPDTARTCLFTTPVPAPSSGGPSSASQEDAYNTGQRVAKKRKGPGMPDSFDRLTSAFCHRRSLSDTARVNKQNYLGSTQKMAQDTDTTFLKVTFAPQYCSALACPIASFFLALLPCVLQLMNYE